MKILMTGATGWVGQTLGIKLVQEGHSIVALVRDTEAAQKLCPFPADFIKWDYKQNESVPDSIAGIDAVIHLMGEPVAGKRWNKSVKQSILDSRVISTKKLMQFALNKKIKKFISASAIGFYGARGDEELTERSTVGQGFLADVCRQWESEVLDRGFKGQAVCFRIGVVLGRGGGALDKMLPAFKSGAGGPLGGGNQWLSWIHLDDLQELILAAVKKDSYQGVINATSPNPSLQKDFAKVLGQAIDRPTILNTPSIALKLALGEMSDVLLASAKVLPQKAQELGFKFKFSQLTESLLDILQNQKQSQNELVCRQYVPQKPDELFPFFADEYNLEKLTPPFLNFKVLGKSTDEVRNNSLIDYQLKLYGIPFKWRTQILDWNPPQKFVDTQLSGPYKKWHHTHTFEKLGNGTLMTDVVIYQLPLGYLGQLSAGWKVTSDVSTIFNYRRQVIFDMFIRTKS
jgi:uncharacterized protein (TIGR01777 family)